MARVVGHYNSGASIPASRILAPAGILMVTPGSSNPLLTKQNFATVFRVVSTDDLQGPLDARLALAQEWRRLALVHTDNADARGLADAFRGEYRARGGELVLDVEMPYNRLDRFLAQLPSVVALGGAGDRRGCQGGGDVRRAAEKLRAMVVRTLANGEWRANAEGDMVVRPIWFFRVEGGRYVQIGEEK